MANTAGYVDLLRPADFQREMGIGYDATLSMVQTNDLWGLELLKKDNHGYIAVSYIPGSLTVGTGLDFIIMVTDDGQSTLDLGKVINVGVTVKQLVNNQTTNIDTAGVAEVAADITLSATSGGVAIATIALTDLDATAAGEGFMIRIRRVATAATETCDGRVILLGVVINNTITL